MAVFWDVALVIWYMFTDISEENLKSFQVSASAMTVLLFLHCWDTAGTNSLTISYSKPNILSLISENKSGT
jgi:hypothetical protein